MTSGAEAPHIGLVVEGPGDVAAVPVLLRRWLEAREEFHDVLGKPVSCNGRDKALRARGLEGKVAIAGARPGCQGILVILDGEGDPVCALGPQLYERATTVTGLPVSIALADPSFEGWLVSSAETMKVPGLEYGAPGHPQAKLKKALAPAKYIKPSMQPRFAHRLDFGLAIPRDFSLKRMLERFDALCSGIDLV